jgi:Raf kinase inhibitor-like YbhB/YbcL family protein
MTMTTPAFQSGQAIPAKYTCEGADISPPLQWTEVPAGAKSLSLIFDDPDAPVGTWVHWVLYNLPVAPGELSENMPDSDELSNGAKQGLNDFKRVRYGGPCPPPGKFHRYYFKLYALDSVLGLRPRATKKDLLRSMEGHILAEAQFMGTYQRRR